VAWSFRRRIKFRGNTPASTGGGGGGSRTLLQQSDFTWLGAFKLPVSLDNGADTRFGGSCTIRHIGGVPYYCGVAQGHVYRATIPTLSTGAYGTYTESTIVKRYVDAFESIPFSGNGGSGPYIYWDETDQKLYGCYEYDNYDNATGDDNSICRTTLVEGTGSSGGSGVSDGEVGITGILRKSRDRSIARVPGWYASAYMSSVTHVTIAGGYRSIAGTGHVSMGPAIVGVNFSTFTANSSYGGTPLVGYWPYASSSNSTLGRMDMPATDYPRQQMIDSWPTGSWSWSDNAGLGVWIDTGTKHGVLYPVDVATGRQDYILATFGASGYETWWVVYDPMEFTPASGTLRYQVQPSTNWAITYPAGDFDPIVPDVKAVTSVSESSGVYTWSVTGHGYSAGLPSRFISAGFTPATWNGGWSLTSVIDANTFTTGSATSGAPTGTPSTIGTVERIYADFDPRPIFAAAFDSVSNRLYLAYLSGDAWPASRIHVNVWQVS
jgi:hypothetical protein